jgi:hypothetical protein
MCRHQDFGVWNISYTTVTCQSNWAGSKDAAALGSVASLGDGGCCPANPTVRDVLCHLSSHSVLRSLEYREMRTTPARHSPIKVAFRT